MDGWSYRRCHFIGFIGFIEQNEQCGGEDWTGSTCCAGGYECVDVSGVGCYEQVRGREGGGGRPAENG